METTSLLLSPPLPPPPPPPPPPWQTTLHPLNNFPFLLQLPTLHTSLTLTFTQSSFRFRLFAIRSRKFDFSALNFDNQGNDGGGGSNRRSRRKRKSDRWSKQRKWWSDDDDDENSVYEKPRSGTLNQVIDNVWIFKVLRSYGWFLPAILLSLLLSTGPKAFLMAFSLPLGLSLIILAFKKLWEWLDGKPKPTKRRKTRSPFSIGYDFLMEEEDDQEHERQLGKKRNWKKDFQSRVARNGSSIRKGSSGGRHSPSSFGGWDELVREEEVEHAQRFSPKMARPEKPEGEAQMNRSLEKRDMPLVLRLLVSVFPFLGSWIESL